MSETELARLALVGVGPNSRSLKFLNNKNNIADKILQKRLTTIERERSSHLNVIEHEKINAKHFLKHVQSLDQDTEEVDKLLQKDDIRSITPPPKKPRDRRRRKIRLAQTAPAHGSSHNAEQTTTNLDRKLVKSGPETEAEKNQMMLQTDRKKSMFIQLTGRGRNRDDSDEDTTPRKLTLPKPSPKTMLDIMIGLNAFSFVPPPTCSSTELIDNSPRSDTRSSIYDRDSIYDSSENIGKKFISNWKSKVANRKQSIFRKLEDNEPRKPLQRSESIATSCIPEETDSSVNLFRKRKSKWTMRHSMRAPTLPAIGDDDERMEQFRNYVKEAKEKERNENTKDYPQLGTDKTSERRRSFVKFLQERKDLPKSKNVWSDDEEEDNDGLTYKGISLVQKDEKFKPAEIGDLMKTILKIKTSFRDPVDSRVRRFLAEIDKIKARDEAAQRTLTKKERKRRWVTLTRGIDAALADSSDDDDNYGYPYC